MNYAKTGGTASIPKQEDREKNIGKVSRKLIHKDGAAFIHQIPCVLNQPDGFASC